MLTRVDRSPWPFVSSFLMISMRRTKYPLLKRPVRNNGSEVEATGKWGKHVLDFRNDKKCPKNLIARVHQRNSETVTKMYYRILGKRKIEQSLETPRLCISEKTVKSMQRDNKWQEVIETSERNEVIPWASGGGQRGFALLSSNCIVCLIGERACDFERVRQ